MTSTLIQDIPASLIAAGLDASTALSIRENSFDALVRLSCGEDEFENQSVKAHTVLDALGIPRRSRLVTRKRENDFEFGTNL